MSAPSRTLLRAVDLFCHRSGLWIVTLARDPDGLLLASKPYFALEPFCSPRVLGQVARQALAASMRSVRRSQDDRTRRLSALVGLPWGQFARTASSAALRDFGEHLIIAPLRHGKKGGFVSTVADPAFPLLASASATCLGSELLQHLQSSLHWPETAATAARRSEIGGASPKRPNPGMQRTRCARR